MNSEKVITHAKRVAEHMIGAAEPSAAMMEILETYINDDAVSATDMIKILSSSIILLTQSLDDCAVRSITVTAGLLALLYADRSPPQLAQLAAGLMARQPEDDAGPSVRVVLVRRRE